MFYFHVTFILLNLVFWLYLVYAAWEVLHKRAPFVPSFGNPQRIAFQKISALLDRAETQQTLIDAGCGTGNLLARLAKRYPQHCFIGIEYNPVLYKHCLLRHKKISNLSFLHQYLLDFDYNRADIIYYFGLPALTRQLQKKLKATAKTLDLITLDAEFPELHFEEKEKFRIWCGESYIYHYKN